MFEYLPKRHGQVRRFRVFVPLLALIVLGGCAVSANVKQIDQLDTVAGQPTIVVMPPDVRYYLLTAGGVAEPNVEWTQAAQTNFSTALRDYAATNGTKIREIDRSNMGEQELKYESLHAVVGRTILNHYFSATKLPSKGERFDWSLGPDIASIGTDHEAEYALFVTYRDYQASGGRVAFSVLAAVAGVGVSTGSESGFASLVDLKSGNIVWFNVVGSGSGELRDASGAAAAVKTLFKDLPGGNAAD